MRNKILSGDLKRIWFLTLLFCFTLTGLTAPAIVQAQSDDPRDYYDWRNEKYMNPNDNLKIFDEVWSKVKNNYYNPQLDGVDWERAKEIYRPQAKKAEVQADLKAVLNQMLGQLKGSHLGAWYYPSLAQLEESLPSEVFVYKSNGRLLPVSSFWSPGFYTKKIEGKDVVTSIIKDGLADHHVQIGWVLESVDTVPPNKPDALNNVHSDEFYNYHFLDNRNKPVTVPLVPNLFAYKPVRSSAVLKDGVGYLKLNDFNEGTASSWITQTMAGFKQLKAVIVDLRGNTGGQVLETQKALSPYFAGDTKFGALVGRNEKAQNLKIKGSGSEAFTGQIIVLVDRQTESAAEMFATVIQENDRGQIVGSETAGKVLGSEDFYLIRNFELQVPMFDYISPGGVRIEGIGVKPNDEVTPTLNDIRTNRDPVLEEALRLT